MYDSLDDVSVDLRQVMLGIAKALDSIGIDDINHGHRVAYIAYQCAKKMGWKEELAQMAFGVGLIHDCGVSEHAQRDALLSHLLPNNTQVHCQKGYDLVAACGPLRVLANAVLYHHTHWMELTAISDISPVDKQLAALTFVSDRVDYLFVNAQPYACGSMEKSAKQGILAELVRHSGTLFEPNMVFHMCKLMETDDFWFSMEKSHIENMIRRFPNVPFFDSNTGLEQTIELAELLAKIIDAKSAFTFQHSKHVADLAAFFGRQIGYSSKMQRMLYLAGLLHDLGKLKTPSSILHKPSDLNDKEYACIKRHATDTRSALQSMIRSPQIVDWAANHHERLDGSGYPQGKVAEELDQPSRLIAVADVFQALTQSRPYRPGLSAEDAMSIIRKQVSEGGLDADIASCLERNLEACFEISTGCTQLERVTC